MHLVSTIVVVLSILTVAHVVPRTPSGPNYPVTEVVSSHHSNVIIK